MDFTREIKGLENCAEYLRYYVRQNDYSNLVEQIDKIAETIERHAHSIERECNEDFDYVPTNPLLPELKRIKEKRGETITELERISTLDALKYIAEHKEN